MPRYMYIVIGIIAGNIALLLLTIALVTWMFITEGTEISANNSGRICVFYEAEIYCIYPERLPTNGE